MRHAALILVVAASSCTPSYQSGHLLCSTVGQRCPDGFSCVGGVCYRKGQEPADMGSPPDDLAPPGTCTTGQTFCVGSMLQICNPTHDGFVNADTCATRELCLASTGLSCQAPACAAGDNRCGGAGSNTVQTCNPGRTGWTDVMVCPAPRTCGGNGVCSGCAGSLPGPTMVAVGNYCIDSTEVTQAQYQTFLTAKGNDFSGQPPECSSNNSYAQLTSGFACTATTWDPINRASYPAGCSDWCDAVAYCKWAGKHLCGLLGGGPNGYLDANDATKSEWYNACTQGGSSTYPYGSTYTTYCDTNASDFRPVANNTLCAGTATPYSSVYDLSGNAWEWEDSCSVQSGTRYCRLRGGSYKSGGADPTQYQCNVGDSFPFDITGAGIRCCAF